MENIICINLEKIKEENVKKYEEARKILKFVYNTAKEKSFKTDLYDKLMSNNGIVEMLFDICNDKDERFAQKFFQKTSIPIDFLEDDILGEPEPYRYVFNLYTMLKAYECNKENYENFEAIVKDVCYTFDCGDGITMDDSTTEKWLQSKKELIDKIVNIKEYSNNKLLRELLKRTISEISMVYEKEEIERLNEMFSLYRNLNIDLERYKRCGYVVSDETVKEVLEDITLLVHRDLLPGSEPLYDRILLLGDRYKCLKEAIKVVLPQHRKEVFAYLKHLNLDMFEELNQDSKEDSFNECIKIIFDSDTYQELLEKLDIIKMASKEYEYNKNKSLAFSLLKDLGSDKHKEVVDGKIISYPTDSINKINKPDSIAKRMEYLYKQNDLINPGINLIYDQPETIIDYLRKIETERESYKKLKNKSKEELQETPVKKKRFSFLGQ